MSMKILYIFELVNNMIMAVPGFQSLLLPFLELLKDKKVHSVKEVLTSLSKQFKLTDKDLQEMVPSQRQSKMYNRVIWAGTYLKKAGLIKSAGRGVFTITEEGLKVLGEKQASIDIAFLMRYPSFAEFKTVRGSADEVATKIQPKNEETQTPAEDIDQQYRIIQRSLAQEILDKIRARKNDAWFLEQLVVDLLLAMGYGGSDEEAGKAIGKTADGGVDGIINEDKLGLDVIYLQAKNWEKKVQESDIRDFVGALINKGARKGVFITTSDFSQPAWNYDPKNVAVVKLINGERLAQLMIDYNIGVTLSKRYDIKKIDSGFFEE